MMSDKGDWVLKLLIGIVWAVIFATLTGLVNATVTNERASQERDSVLHIRATSNESRINRLEECQISTKEQFSDLKTRILVIDAKLDRLLMKQ